MIFASVGTHEDPFDRLVTELDRLVDAGIIKEEVIMQRGYSRDARNFASEAMMPFPRVQSLMAQARVVITHGGPATIMQALSHGKVPVVIPRQPQFGEHVDGHQIQFAKRLSDRVIVVLEIGELAGVLRDYDALVAGLKGGEPPRERARKFAGALADLVDALCEAKK